MEHFPKSLGPLNTIYFLFFFYNTSLFYESCSRVSHISSPISLKEAITTDLGRIKGHPVADGQQNYVPGTKAKQTNIQTHNSIRNSTNIRKKHTDTHVGGNSTDVDVVAALLPDQVLQHRLCQVGEIAKDSTA